MPSLRQLEMSETSTAPSVTQPAPAAQSGDRHWLSNLLAPRQITPRQRAISQLESSGMPFTDDGFVRAVSSGHRPLVDLFLTAGMDINATATNGHTLLLAAALARQWPLVDQFIQSGASVNTADLHGLTPLMASAMAN